MSEAPGWRERFRALKEPRGFGVVLVIALALPALWAISATAQDILGGTRHFGSNPVKEVEHYLGRATLRLVMATLCITPLRQLTGWNWLAKHRRTLGLYAFAYLTLHWIAYAFLDVQLDLAELTKDLLKRPYIYLGMTALVLMIPLAITSRTPMKTPLELQTVETAAELPGFEFSNIAGFVAPAKVPRPVIELLARELRVAAQDKGDQDKRLALGVFPRDLGPEEFDAFIRADVERIGELVKSLGIKPN